MPDENESMRRVLRQFSEPKSIAELKKAISSLPSTRVLEDLRRVSPDLRDITSARQASELAAQMPPFPEVRDFAAEATYETNALLDQQIEQAEARSREERILRAEQAAYERFQRHRKMLLGLSVVLMLAVVADASVSSVATIAGTLQLRRPEVLLLFLSGAILYYWLAARICLRESGPSTQWQLVLRRCAHSRLLAQPEDERPSLYDGFELISKFSFPWLLRTYFLAPPQIQQDNTDEAVEVRSEASDQWIELDPACGFTALRVILASLLRSMRDDSRFIEELAPFWVAALSLFLFAFSGRPLEIVVSLIFA